ncbi:MAG: LamB/YcsF family protein [Ilumatobacteraceae bacterium]
MPAARIDLNSDVGEGFGAWAGGPDDQLIPLLTSVNVACGFHAGDPSIMRRTCAAAVAAGCAIGAQVSYPDLAGFGRRFMEMRPAELTDAVLYQLGALEAMAAVAGGRVAYVKPHGALYNAIVHHAAQAGAVAAGVREHGGGLAVLGLPGSEIETACCACRHPLRGGGVRRPGLHTRRPAGAADRAGCAADGPCGCRGPGGAALGGWRGLDLRAQRHARGAGDPLRRACRAGSRGAAIGAFVP